MRRTLALAALLSSGCAVSMSAEPKVTRVVDLVKEGTEPVSLTTVHGDDVHTVNLVQVRGKIRPHVHKRSHEIVYVIEGEGTLRLGGETRRVRAGDEIFVPRGAVHAFEATHCVVLSLFTPGFVPGDRHFVEE